MLTVPYTLDKTVETLLELAGTIPTALAASTTKLAAISYPYVPAEIPAAASAVTAIRTALDLLLDQSGQIITVHPWTYGAAETGQGNYSEQLNGFLSPGAALQRLADKLQDQADSGKDQASSMICFHISSNSLAIWLARLTALCTIFPVGDLQLCQRRAEQLLALNSEKLEKPTPFKNPHWKDLSFLELEKSKEIRQVTENLVESVDAYALDINPVAELESVIVQKTAELTEAAAKWAIIKGTLAGDPGSVISLSGSPQTMAAGVAQLAVPDPRQYCALVAIIGNDLSLQFFRELFNL